MADTQWKANLRGNHESSLSSTAWFTSAFPQTMAADGHEDMSVELFGGKAKGDLFQAAFNLKLTIEPKPHPPQTPPA